MAFGYIQKTCLWNAHLLKNTHPKWPLCIKRQTRWILHKKEVWTTLCHAMEAPHRILGFKSKERYINLWRHFTVGVGEEKLQKKLGCQVTPQWAWYDPLFRAVIYSIFFMSRSYLYSQLIEDGQLRIDTETDANVQRHGQKQQDCEIKVLQEHRETTSKIWFSQQNYKSYCFS